MEVDDMTEESKSQYVFFNQGDSLDLMKKVNSSDIQDCADFRNYCCDIGMKKFAYDILSFTCEMDVYDEDGNQVPFEKWFWSSVLTSKVPPQFSTSFIFDQIKPTLKRIYVDSLRKYRDRSKQ